MEQTNREKWASWIGMFFAIIPSMIVSGFMPDWNVLPELGWLGITAAGCAIAGAISTPRTLPGMITGMLAGTGMMVASWKYVALRQAVIDSDTYYHLELVIAGLIGAAPGMMLYNVWARVPPSETQAPPIDAPPPQIP